MSTNNDPTLVADWRLDQERRGLMPRTVYKRCSQTLTWVRWCEHSGGVGAQRAEDVQRFLDARRIGSRTRYHWLSTLHVFYRWAIDAGRLDHDPTATIHRPRLRRSLPRPVSDGDLARSVQLADPMMRAWLTLMAFNGLRCAEVGRLRSEDIVQNATMLRVLGKGDRERIIPLHPDALRALREHGLPRRGYLFTRPQGGPFPPPLVSRTACLYLRSIDLDVVPHQYRHWFGTKAYEACRDIRVVQELMGHSSPSVTAVYAAYSEETARHTVKAIRLPGADQRSLFAA